MTALMPVRVGARFRRLGEARCVRERRGALSASSRRARSDGLESGGAATQEPPPGPRLIDHSSCHGFLFFACIKSLRNLAALLRYLFIGQGLYGYVCVTPFLIIGLNTRLVRRLDVTLMYALYRQPRSCESRTFNI